VIELYTTATFDKLFVSLPRKIQLKADRKTELFLGNPFNRTLRTEKLHPKKHDVWSFRVDRDYRIVFKFTGPGKVEFRYIGHHNCIYDYDIFG